MTAESILNILRCEFVNPGKLAKKGQVGMYERSDRGDLLPVPGHIPDTFISAWKTRPESPMMQLLLCSYRVQLLWCWPHSHLGSFLGGDVLCPTAKGTI